MRITISALVEWEHLRSSLCRAVEAGCTLHSDPFSQFDADSLAACANDIANKIGSDYRWEKVPIKRESRQ